MNDIERRLATVEADVRHLQTTLEDKLGSVERRASERHAELLGLLDAAKVQAKAAAQAAQENREVLDRAYWLSRQLRWIVPASGAIGLWASGQINWTEIVATVRKLGG